MERELRFTNLLAREVTVTATVGNVLKRATPKGRLSPKNATTRRVLVHCSDRPVSTRSQSAVADQLRTFSGVGEVQTLPDQNIEILTVAAADAADAVRALKLPGVVSACRGELLVEEDAEVHLISTNHPTDPSFDRLWGLHNDDDHDIDAPEAWARARGDNGFVVAVIDTGADYNHPDLIDNAWVNEAELNGQPGIDDDGNGYIDDIHGYDFANDDGDPMDDHSHGTHCAGTIGASGNNGEGIVGVAWAPKIMALKFLSATGGGSVSDALRALEYAMENGATITSNSWGGGPRSAVFDAALKTATQLDHLFIAAAGNNNQDNDANPTYACNYQQAAVLCDAATTREDERSWFSNYGATSVHVAAPGSDIFSTVPNGAYQPMSGTSMATPHVAGLAVLLQSWGPLGGAMTRRAILDSVDVIPALQGLVSTGGRINANAALQMAKTVEVSPKEQAVVVNGAGRVILRTDTDTPRTADYVLRLAVAGHPKAVEV